MNANVSIYQDSVKDSSGILTSESNEIGSLKIIMPDKLNQLTARSSYICHIDDFVKGNKDYYGFDIQSDREMEYDYELIINKIKHVNNNTGKYEHISIFNDFQSNWFLRNVVHISLWRLFLVVDCFVVDCFVYWVCVFYFFVD